MQPIRHILLPVAAPTPPPPTPCQRIATNQISPTPAEPLPNTPGSGVWTGAVSGATGLHQRYEYLQVDAGPPIVYQQFIVMSGVVGVFIAGEILNHVP